MKLDKEELVKMLIDNERIRNLMSLTKNTNTDVCKAWNEWYI